MDSVKSGIGFLAALTVGGGFWQGFADVLSKAAVPTNSIEFGKALAAVALVLVPQLVQWLIGRLGRKQPRTADELEQLLNKVVATHLAGHYVPTAAAPSDVV